MTNTKNNETLIYILNGSPRKNWNTAKMCESFKNGAQNTGINAEIINLYDLNYKGCYSCFACKVKNGKSCGKCAYPDELKKYWKKYLTRKGLFLPHPYTLES